MAERILIEAGNIIAWLNVQIEKARRGDLPIDTIAYYGDAIMFVKNLPTIEAEPVRHGRWIECDYKHLEHGMIETEPNAGLCCSECRAAFQKKKMTYKQYCAACGARMAMARK